MYSTSLIRITWKIIHNNYSLFYFIFFGGGVHESEKFEAGGAEWGDDKARLPTAKRPKTLLPYVSIANIKHD